MALVQTDVFTEFSGEVEMAKNRYPDLGDLLDRMLACNSALRLKSLEAYGQHLQRTEKKLPKKFRGKAS